MDFDLTGFLSFTVETPYGVATCAFRSLDTNTLDCSGDFTFIGYGFSQPTPLTGLVALEPRPKFVPYASVNSAIRPALDEIAANVAAYLHDHPHWIERAALCARYMELQGNRSRLAAIIAGYESELAIVQREMHSIVGCLVKIGED